jgi:zinc D-Ala-D-Ala carboxypeptidase
MGIAGRRRLRMGATLLLLITVVGCSSNTPSLSPSGSTGSPGLPSATTGQGTPQPTGSGGPTAPGVTQEPGTSPTPSGPVSTPAGPGEAPPTCQYVDEPAVGNPNKDWATMVLDTIYRLPADFAPKKVVSTSKAGLQSGFEVIPAVVDDLKAMHLASIDDGAEIAVRWAYRSYGEQQGAFAYWVRHSGEEAALKASARPGHSEHQMGTAIDFRSADSLKAPWDYDDWATTKPGAWMGANAWRFGFVLSYPKGMEAQTCYAYEPWHYRYVGRDLAQQEHDSGLTLREFLWGLAHPAN